MIESEKALEIALHLEIRKLGGWTLKLLPFQVSGLPDRVCLLPRGRLFFAEIKTTKKDPSRRQRYVHSKLRLLGFRVEVIDRSVQIEELIKEYTKE